MTNLQDRVRAEASVCDRKPGPKASQNRPEHLPMLRLAERVRSGAARADACIRGGSRMACKTLPAHPASRRRPAAIVIPLLFAARIAPNPRKMGLCARVPLFFHCY